MNTKIIGIVNSLNAADRFDVDAFTADGDHITSILQDATEDQAWDAAHTLHALDTGIEIQFTNDWG